jgi:site-specific DNA recombinase
MEKIKYIMYCRKSSESEDKQVQSIEAQQKALKKLAAEKNLTIVKVLEESQSAKKPGRPIFTEMINILSEGKADGILCWKPNRLARNPIDGGTIQWMLQSGLIKSINTPSNEYLPTDNILMLGVEFGMANQFILDLSKDVKRGLNAKAEKGWLPHIAPIGYINDKAGNKGEKIIYKDPNRFPILRKMWNLMLTGHYSVQSIVTIANNDWVLTCSATNKLPERQISLSTGYKIFTSPFYYGKFYHSGQLYDGKHEPLVTEEEFKKVKNILGRKNNSRPKNKNLPFRGIINCGECGAMITAEEKFKTIKQTNEKRKYLYHRCTKRKRNIKCHQKTIRTEILEEQIIEYLENITLPKEILKWCVETLKENKVIEENNTKDIINNLETQISKLETRIHNLTTLFISPENNNKEMLSDEEFKKEKLNLNEKISSLKSQLTKIQEEDKSLELSIETFDLAANAKHFFLKGDNDEKNQILSSIGSNYSLKDRKLDISLIKPLQLIADGLKENNTNMIRLEPSKNPLNINKNTSLKKELFLWGAQRESNPH